VETVTITQEQFDSLLAWLATDRELAGMKYESVRSGLVRIFISRGFNDAEDLADETINRVMVRLPDICGNYIGEPARYFYGVARNVIRENLHRKEIAFDVIDVHVQPKPEVPEEQICLKHWLQRLPRTKREFILHYYLYDGHDKIEHHKRMAGKLNITLGAFRSRAFQIRLHLQNCMRQCPCTRQIAFVPAHTSHAAGSQPRLFQNEVRRPANNT
jgi:DNA-directed RNA polymerase specialized sigma24 family protein